MIMRIKRSNAFFSAGLFCLFLFLANISFAQDTKKDKAVKALTDTMKTQLSLDDGQYSKVYDINADFLSGLATVKADGGGKMAKFNKLKAIGKDRDNALKAVLSAEQYKTYQEHKKENRQEMKSRYKERSARQ